MSVILLTGASGFLGQAIAKRLGAKGHEVRAATRTGGAVPGAAICVAVGDLTHADHHRVVAGCEVLVHCAARVHVLRDNLATAEADYAVMNRDLPINLAAAAGSAGARQFIQLSSVAAVASSTRPGEVVDDDTPPRPVTPYGRSKLAADRGLAAMASDGFVVTSLRPPTIFGPGAGALFDRFDQAARMGMPLPLAAIGNQRSFAYSENIADAVARVIEKPQSGAWLVTDSAPISVGMLYDKLVSLHGKGRRTFFLPAPLVSFAAKRALGARAESLLGNAAFDGARFARDFDWEPPVSFERALEITVRTASQ